MWPDQRAITTPSGSLQANETKIESNLNPYAKEFYPSNMKLWPKNESNASDTKAKVDLRTSQLIEAPQEARVKIYHTVLEMADVKFKATAHNEMYANSTFDTKIKIIPESMTLNPTNVGKLKNKPIVTLNNNNTGAIRKTTLTKSSNGNKANNVAKKPQLASLKTKSATNPQSSSGFNLIKGPAANATNIAATKSNVLTKVSPPKSVASCNKTSLKTNNNKDSLSLKSATSSDKSNSSTKLNANPTKTAMAANDKTSSTSRCVKKTISCKTPEKTTTTSSKLKETLVKSPRTTVASNLRKTEIQKVS